MKHTMAKWKTDNEFTDSGRYSTDKKYQRNGEFFLVRDSYAKICSLCGCTFGEHYATNCPNRPKK